MEPEIISVEFRRRVRESPTKLLQVPGRTHAGIQMRFKYTIISRRIDLNGNRIPHSTIRSVCRESRAEYSTVRSAALHIAPRGHKLYFNPYTDILYFSDLSSIYAHHMRQRYRRTMPMVKGLDQATKLAFDPVADDERMEELGEEIMRHYETRIAEIQQSWARNGQSYKLDHGWDVARNEEGDRLWEEMKFRNIRRSDALGRVNGAFQDENATILRLPLTQADL
ncbi:hypothetical protein NA56DRAFT_713525 [Hyaloscypha hepaticicola]|uniref:Uncharacterized protein n=1 Tax=Hyaloscypha hepaticicola TaxID=2082293 RepID=A0A2J6PDG5_9HELO|nr:hypothetical protein NA56DRAFT_713525 [Hyaloscypha hepaticicola]